MMVSKFFTLAELTKSETASRRSIANEPDQEQIGNLTDLCLEVLDPIREEFGIPFSPSSGFRSLSLNEVLGGADGSQHLDGMAADIEIPGVSNRSLALWIRDNLDFDQLILESFSDEDPSSGWVHVSYSRENNRFESLTHDESGGYVNGVSESEERASWLKGILNIKTAFPYFINHLIIALTIGFVFQDFFVGAAFYTGREIRDWQKLGYFDHAGFWWPVLPCVGIELAIKLNLL